MNSQELETAKRIGANITVVVWRDDGYGLIDWKQRNEFGRPFGVEFGNPDFVAYARVVRDRRVPAGVRRRPATRRSCARSRSTGPSLVEVPIDYRENLRLTEHLGALAGRLSPDAPPVRPVRSDGLAARARRTLLGLDDGRARTLVARTVPISDGLEARHCSRAPGASRRCAGHQAAEPIADVPPRIVARVGRRRGTVRIAIPARPRAVAP